MDLGLDGCASIPEFVARQIKGLKQCPQTMESVFGFAFSIEGNVMAEYSDGNKIYEITYGECKRNIIALSGRMAHLLADIPKSSIIGLNMDNRLEWIEIFWALLRIGFIPLLMNKRLPISSLEKVLKEHGASAVITDDTDFCVPTFGYKKFYEDTPQKVDCESWADEIIFMSSGTSEAVKLCRYNGKKICQQIYNSKQIVDTSKSIHSHVEGKLKQLTFLPFYHVFGFLACYMWFAFFARTFVFLKSLHADTLLKTVKRHKVTHIFAIPMLWTKIEAAALKTISERGEATKKKFEKGLKIAKKLSGTPFGNSFSRIAFKEVRENIFGESIRFMISGGGAIPAHTIEFFNAIGYPLANGYGMTEIGITSVELSTKKKIVNTGSVGVPFKSAEYKLDENGALLVKGSSTAYSVTCGDNTEYIDEDQWFATRDLAAFRNGRWYIEGRQDDMIVNTSGENVYPEAIEKKLSPNGCELALIGVKSDDGSVRCTLIIHPERLSDAERVREDITNQLKESDLYRRIDDIRLTASPLMLPNEFKLNRKRLARDASNGALTYIKASGKTEIVLTGETQKRVGELFAKVLSCTITPEQYDSNFFFDLNGSSLSYFELVEELKREYSVDLLAQKERVLYTVNEISAYLCEEKK